MNGGIATLECPEIHSVYYVERFHISFRGRIQGYVKLCVETSVAVTFWRLANNVEYRTISELFGLRHSTVGEIVMDTCSALLNICLKYTPHTSR